MTALLSRSGSPAVDSGKSRSRKLAVLLILAVSLLLVALASVAIGARGITLGTVFEALGHLDQIGKPGVDPSGDWAVVQTRVPRTVAGILVGACLGLAGTAMQGVARNPLADPGILGVNAGAALSVIVAVVLFGVGAASGYVWFAFVGAAAAAVVVYAVASLGREGATPVKLALAGAAISAGLASLLQALLITNQGALNAFRNWQVGSVAGKNWDQVLAVLPFMLVGIGIVLFTGRWLNGLALGDDLARGLGQNPALARGVTAVGIVLLCGAATALAGPVGFIGLVVPHLLRALIGTDYRWLLPYSVLTAPIILVSADVVGRVILLPGEVAAGVISVFVGAPVFIWLVRKRKAVSL
ncbi:FecCD family ABC transporter permease [Arthrobacter russicus]|uniref:Iron complex transport system permease protein n=1 Tax=Arthrobacter russicus TaxID=172040 RepID=A0ABU1JCU9_9MICC|nr:iron ABC transporter permease [Arthrobacter russicus]MDR6269980.1 iron complex transport system permease protein [Arthrobacter russicus]